MGKGELPKDVRPFPDELQGEADHPIAEERRPQEKPLPREGILPEDEEKEEGEEEEVEGDLDGLDGEEPVRPPVWDPPAHVDPLAAAGEGAPHPVEGELDEDPGRVVVEEGDRVPLKEEGDEDEEERGEEEHSEEGEAPEPAHPVPEGGGVLDEEKDLRPEGLEDDDEEPDEDPQGP